MALPPNDSPTTHRETLPPPVAKVAEDSIKHIDLALSGGGFRATLFHLGVIGFLQSQGLLNRVRIICSVSGGSILAAHMVTRWHEYEHHDVRYFIRAVEHLLRAIQHDDISGRALLHLRSAYRVLFRRDWIRRHSLMSIGASLDPHMPVQTVDRTFKLRARVRTETSRNRWSQSKSRKSTRPVP